MKSAIKIFPIAIVLLINCILGCADFPDEYAVSASIGDIRMKEGAKLSEDGMSYTSAILVDFDIRKNTFNEIKSAIVTIDGKKYDVKDQIDPSKGGTVEIPCTLECNKEVAVGACLKIVEHSFDSQKSLAAHDFIDKIKSTTGKAEQISPCSAVLRVDVNYPWLINTYDYFMLVDKDPFNLSVNSGTGTFKGKTFACIGYNSDLYCPLSSLDANTTYFYQMVRLDNNSRVIYSGETKSFTTTEATAKITTSVNNIELTSATGNVTFDPGNLNGLYTTYNQNKTIGGRMFWYYGKTLEELDSASRKMLNGGMSNITYPYTFSGLDASTKYYYRCDFYIGEGFMCSSGIREFTTQESTASIDVTKNNVFVTHAEIGITLNKGNTKGVISSSGAKSASVRIFYGTSKDNMIEKGTASAYNNDAFDFKLDDLAPNRQYYYEVCYYAGKSLLATSGIKEIKTYSEIAHLPGLKISTIKYDSSSNKVFTITAQRGNVLAFDYRIDPGSNSLKAELAGPQNETILEASSSRSDWNTGSVYYVFPEAGTYTLTLSYYAHSYGHIEVPEILLIR